MIPVTLHARPLARRLPPAVALLAVALLFSAAPHGDAEDGGVDPADTTSVSYFGCIGHFGNMPMRAQDAAAYVPDGFQTIPWIGAGAPGSVLTGVFGQACPHVTTDNGYTTGSYVEIMHLLRLTPPPEHAAPGAHTVAVRFMTNDPFLAQVYDRWNVAHETLGVVGLETTYYPFFNSPQAGLSYGADTDWGLVIANENLIDSGNFPGLLDTFYGVAPDGSLLNKIHLDIKASPFWVGVMQTSYSHGSPGTLTSHAGIGSSYQWAPGVLTQTFAYGPA